MTHNGWFGNTDSNDSHTRINLVSDSEGDEYQKGYEYYSTTTMYHDLISSKIFYFYI